MNTYEINQFQQVVPYTSGRRCNDTRAWRDATELELQQQEEIKELKQIISDLEFDFRNMQEELESNRQA